jgi:AraC-like DNA-binding protein
MKDETVCGRGLCTYGPPPLLRRYVAYFWTMQCPDVDRSTLELLANPVSGIIVQQYNGRSALTRTNQTQACTGTDIPTAFIYGTRSQPGQLLARGSCEMTGAVFRPQALRTLLKIDPAEVRNGPLTVADLPERCLEDQLLNAASAPERVAVLGKWLSARVGEGISEDGHVSESLRLLRANVRTVRIRWLLKQCAISERQLERRFRRAIGVSPHLYLRILRFQEVVRVFRERKFRRMCELATELNYSDQAHLGKEMKQFSGYTPTALLQTVRTSIDLPCAFILPPENRVSASQPPVSLSDSRYMTHLR